MKKVLILAYYWPPKGGVGVQRWLKLTKYLCRHKYQPIVYTPEGGITPLQDDSLLSSIPKQVEVIKNKIFEPIRLFSFFRKNKYASDILMKTKSNFLDFIFIWIRTNFFIPDSRSFLIKPSISFLNNYLKSHPVDVIISSGPPHSMHMIALSLKQYHNLKWIADFRDPWTDIEYFDKLPFLPFMKSKHKKMEKKVVSNADLVLSVSPYWASQIQQIGAKKTFVLYNGFDVDDYRQSIQKTNSNRFKIGHFGLYNELRDHSFLWKVINQISYENKEFLSDLQLFFAGEVYDNFVTNMKYYKLDDKLIYEGFLNHNQSIQKMMDCDLLLVTQSMTKSVKGRLPAKVFEYLGAKRPILAIGEKNSDLEKILKPISYAWFVDFNNSKLLFDTILEIYELCEISHYFSDDISKFSRENQVKTLIKLIEDL